MYIFEYCYTFNIISWKEYLQFIENHIFILNKFSEPFWFKFFFKFDIINLSNLVDLQTTYVDSFYTTKSSFGSLNQKIYKDQLYDIYKSIVLNRYIPYNVWGNTYNQFFLNFWLEFKSLADSIPVLTNCMYDWTSSRQLNSRFFSWNYSNQPIHSNHLSEFLKNLDNKEGLFKNKYYIYSHAFEPFKKNFDQIPKLFSIFNTYHDLDIIWQIATCFAIEPTVYGWVETSSIAIPIDSVTFATENKLISMQLYPLYAHIGSKDINVSQLYNIMDQIYQISPNFKSVINHSDLIIDNIVYKDAISEKPKINELALATLRDVLNYYGNLPDYSDKPDLDTELFILREHFTEYLTKEFYEKYSIESFPYYVDTYDHFFDLYPDNNK